MASSRVGARISALASRGPGRHMADRQLLQKRQAKSRGLARTGLGDAQKVAARQQRGNGAGLDGGGMDIILHRKGTEDRLGNAKRSKSYVSHLKS